jgi:hypothetical protein
MPGEEGFQVRLAPCQKAAQVESEDARESEKYDDKNIGQRGRKIAPHFPFVYGSDIHV